MAATVIYSTTITSSQQTISMTNIPQTYKHLWLQVSSRSTNNSDWFTIGVNGDTATTYYQSRAWYVDRNGGTSINPLVQNPPSETPLTGATFYGNGLANAFTQSEIYFPNYAYGGVEKTWLATTSMASNGTPTRQSIYNNTRNAGNAIDSIQLRCQGISTNSNAAYTTVTLFGLP